LMLVRKFTERLSGLGKRLAFLPPVSEGGSGFHRLYFRSCESGGRKYQSLTGWTDPESFFLCHVLAEAHGCSSRSAALPMIRS